MRAMKASLRAGLLATAAVAAFGLASAGTAQAGALAYSIVNVAGVFVGNSDHTALTSGITTGTSSYTSSANANFDGTFVGDSTTGAAPQDVAQQCSGPGCAPWGENNYSVPSGISGDFALGDSEIMGSLFANPPGDIVDNTRADTQIVGGAHTGSGNSSAGGTSSIDVTATSDISGLQIWLAGVDALHAELTDGQSGTAHANGTWNIRVRDTTTGQDIFLWSALNESLGVVTGDPAADVVVDSCDNPDAVTIGANCYISSAFSTSPNPQPTFSLVAGHTYTFTIGHTSLADATTANVPEPMTLTLLGSGLFGLGFIRRKIAKKSRR